jgi:hypothetical protein
LRNLTHKKEILENKQTKNATKNTQTADEIKKNSRDGTWST